MQRSLFFIKKNSSKARIIHVSRANLNRRQAITAREGVAFDACDAIGNRDARQAAAPKEGNTPYAFDRFAPDEVWNHQFASEVFITSGDCHAITAYLIPKGKGA